VTPLYKFGVVSPNVRFVPNEAGCNTDIVEADIIFKRHIPEYLPIVGQKVIVNYPGIPKICNKCYKMGHTKRNCRSNQVFKEVNVVQR